MNFKMFKLSHSKNFYRRSSKSRKNQEYPGLRYFFLYTDTKVCRQGIPGGDCFGKYTDAYAEQITKIDLDTQGIPLDSSTHNTGTGTFPGIPLDSCTHNNRLQDRLGEKTDSDTKVIPGICWEKFCVIL